MAAAAFRAIANAAQRFGVQLRGLARIVNQMIEPFDVTDAASMLAMARLLRQYSELMAPWAEAASTRLINDVATRDASAWYKTSKEVSGGLRHEVARTPHMTPIGATVANLIDSQTRMIRGIPEEAAARMQALAMEYATGGRRYAELSPRIKEIFDMNTNRATLIARTETAKAQSSITQARAVFIGADEYVWHTAHDYDVRAEHRRLNGRTFSWHNPPRAERNGEHHHPGQFPNCRCWAEPVIRKD